MTLVDGPSPAMLIPSTEMVYSVPIHRSFKVTESLLAGVVRKEVPPPPGMP